MYKIFDTFKENIMRKFLTVFLTLLLALTVGITMVGCGGGNSDNGGNGGGDNGGNGGTSNPTPPPTYTSITADEWTRVLSNSPKNNVTIVDKDPANPSRTFGVKITASKAFSDCGGLSHQQTTFTDRTNVNKVIAMYGFYQDIDFADLTFDENNDTYSYNGTITISEVPVLNNYTDKGQTSLIYSNIVITLAKNDYNQLVIGKIALTQTATYAGSPNVDQALVFEYNLFGETEL